MACLSAWWPDLNFHAEEGDDGSLIGRDRVEVTRSPYLWDRRSVFWPQILAASSVAARAAVMPSMSTTPDDLRRKEHALCFDHRDVAWVDVSCSGAAPRP